MIRKQKLGVSGGRKGTSQRGEGATERQWVRGMNKNKVYICVKCHNGMYYFVCQPKNQ